MKDHLDSYWTAYHSNQNTQQQQEPVAVTNTNLFETNEEYIFSVDVQTPKPVSASSWDFETDRDGDALIKQYKAEIFNLKMSSKVKEVQGKAHFDKEWGIPVLERPREQKNGPSLSKNPQPGPVPSSEPSVLKVPTIMAHPPSKPIQSGSQGPPPQAVGKSSDHPGNRIKQKPQSQQKPIPLQKVTGEDGRFQYWCLIESGVDAKSILD